MINGRTVIGIVGTRDRDSMEDYDILAPIFLRLKGNYPNGVIVCSGGCSKGADRFAKIMASERSIPYLEFPADWNKHGKAAGYIRNEDIAKASDILIAMVVEDSVAKGGTYKGGTENTIDHFTRIMKEEEKEFYRMSDVTSGSYTPKRKLIIL